MHTILKLLKVNDIFKLRGLKFTFIIDFGLFTPIPPERSVLFLKIIDHEEQSPKQRGVMGGMDSCKVEVGGCYLSNYHQGN